MPTISIFFVLLQRNCKILEQNSKIMKKKINVLCVLTLALMLIDLVVDLFLNTGDAAIKLDLSSSSLGTLLFLLLVALLIPCAAVVAIVCFVKFILNVNRDQVFTEKNIKLICKYGYCAIVCGVCMTIITVFVGSGFWDAVVGSLDGLGEGVFALLMAEVFGIGLKLQEEKNAVA